MQLIARIVLTNVISPKLKKKVTLIKSADLDSAANPISMICLNSFKAKQYIIKLMKPTVIFYWLSPAIAIDKRNKQTRPFFVCVCEKSVSYEMRKAHLSR